MRAGLPQALDAKVAVTNVWLPLSPYEITRAVSARRIMALTAGMSSFAPALRDHEEQRALSVAAEHRIRSIFHSGTIMTEAMQDTATVANEILRTAKKWGADLIIVGSKTSPSPDITDYAGPALKVAKEAHCSVRIARPSNRKGDSLIRIIIGVDGSDSAAQVVQSVAQRVWPQGSEAHLIAIRKGGSRDPKMDSQITLALEQSAEELRAVGLRVSTAIREGQPQDVLLREARELSADCIFIDSRGLQPALGNGVDRGGLSKAAVALVLGAHCSVEVVRPKNLIDQYLKPAA
jgi:nucleotide-binding universal stress UspA family protein